MGGYNSSETRGAVKFEDQFDYESYVTDELKAQDVIKLREAFEALAERLPNGELGVRASTFKNGDSSNIDNSTKRQIQ